LIYFARQHTNYDLEEATKLLRLIDRRSVSFGIPVDKLLEKISLGGVIIGDVEQDQYEAQSTWTLARWAGPGENRKVIILTLTLSMVQYGH
jgi:hypothetical protein